MVGGIVKCNGVAITDHYFEYHLDNKATEFYTLREYADAHMEHYITSDKTDVDAKYGPRVFYHIQVGRKQLQNAAWYFTDEKKAGVHKDHIGFRVSRIGDPGNPHSKEFRRVEGDGVSVEEDWFG